MDSEHPQPADALHVQPDQGAEFDAREAPLTNAAQEAALSAENLRRSLAASGQIDRTLGQLASLLA